MVTTSRDRFRISWVLVDTLALGPAPLAERHLQRLEAEQIKSVFSLCGEDEVPPPAGLNQRFRFERFVLPDHRSSQILELHQLQAAIRHLDLLSQYGPVYVHCVAAMERSPLLCIAWLVKRQGLTPTEALDYIMQVHPGTNPLPRQLALVRQLESPIIPTSHSESTS